MVHSPAYIWICVLWFMGDTRSRRALRATHQTVENAGELAMAVVFARVHTLNRRPSPFPLLYERLQFWSPWVGYIHPRPPVCVPGPVGKAIMARWQVLWNLRVGNRPLCGAPLHGCSSSTIMFKKYVKGKWVWTWMVFEAAMAEP